MDEYRDLDKDQLRTLGDADVAIACLRMLSSIPGIMAGIGEQRLRGILFVVVPEEGSVVGAIAGNPDSLLTAIETLYMRIPVAEAKS